MPQCRHLLRVAVTWLEKVSAVGSLCARPTRQGCCFVDVYDVLPALLMEMASERGGVCATSSWSSADVNDGEAFPHCALCG